uniref:Uncharacterized protein n=1 Tax=Arundo donax TaxID=35708 RepID=A0A0A9AQJ7_ARUDO
MRGTPPSLPPGRVRGGWIGGGTRA